MADRYRTRHPELTAIEELIQALSLKLTTHLAEEEDTLFPALLELELAYLGESSIAGYPKRTQHIGEYVTAARYFWRHTPSDMG